MEVIAHLAQAFHCPVLTDALNPLRNAESLHPYAITTYDFILRQAQTLCPAVILQIGELPTSKTLRQWLQQTPVLRYVLTDGHPDNFDPLHGPVVHLRGSLDRLGPLASGKGGEPSPTSINRVSWGC